MIPDATVKGIARRLGVDPMIVDLDHALGVVLWALSDVGDPESTWVFKGGTCLRKMYFRDYRFSEDLDFTVTGRLAVDDVRRTLEEVGRRSQEEGVAQARCAAQPATPSHCRRRGLARGGTSATHPPL